MRLGGALTMQLGGAIIMKTNDAQKKTGLTRKALKYYEEQGLVVPSREENGYRHYSNEDIDKLNEISAYRKMGLSVPEIKSILFSESKKEILAEIVKDKKIRQEIATKRINLLEKFALSGISSDIEEELLLIEVQESIYDRLSEKFPGFIGQSMFLSYRPFLQGKIETEEQKQAFDDLVEFLDNMDNPPPMSEEEKEFFQSTAAEISLEMMQSAAEDKVNAVYSGGKWFKENAETIKSYMKYKNSEEYRQSPAYTVSEKMRNYLSDSGFYDVAIPLIRKISPAYDRYYIKLMELNERYEDRLMKLYVED